MFIEDDLLPISSLQHMMFCERQWALIHLEGIWDENRLTVEGKQLHERVHEVESEARKDIRIARGLRLRCLRLGLTGQADVVEFHRVQAGQNDEAACRMAGTHARVEEAGWKPAPQQESEEAGRMPAPQQESEEAGRMPAPQGRQEDTGENCGAGFQPADRKYAPEEIMAAVEPPLTLGSCILRRDDCARIVQDALLHFEGERYCLVAWSIMPNHVHVIVAPLCGYDISGILHSWKSFTSNRINRVLGHTGALWERENFDHVIRSAEDLVRFKDYVEQNPVAGGLCTCSEDWAYSSRGAGFEISELFVFVAPSETPFARVTSRGELPHLHKNAATYFVTFRLLDAVVLKPRGVGWKPAPQGETQHAGRKSAPQKEAEDAGWKPAPQQEQGDADRMSATQEDDVRTQRIQSDRVNCGADFKPAMQRSENCGAGFQPALGNSSMSMGVRLPGVEGLWRPFPIEYKRGKPKPDRCDEVQLCAQVLCLEEMLGVAVPAGAMFYGKTRRRHDVAIDAALRSETEQLAARLHSLYNAGVTPTARYEKKCDNCSLVNVCLPKATGVARRSATYLSRSIAESIAGECGL